MEPVLQKIARYDRAMGDHVYFVYMLASRRNGTLYVGVSNDVMRRTWQHKSKLVEGFTKKYGVHILVWYEVHSDINLAIARKSASRSGIVPGRSS